MMVRSLGFGSKFAGAIKQIIGVDRMSGDLEYIISIVSELGKIPGVGPDEDFYDAGFSSINSLELLVQLENVCEVNIPDDQFITARSARAIHEMIERLQREQGQ
jgi:acyl carrier protein